MKLPEALDNIIKRLKDEDTRWDAILQLKVSTDPTWVQPLIHLLNDADWVVRWSVSEKLGDMRDPGAIRPLVRLLSDPDYHVRKNVSKALIKYGSVMVSSIVPYFSHSDVTVRRHVMSILLASGTDIIPALETALPSQNWVVSNRIVDIIWRLGGESSEDALLRLLKHVDVQKHIVVVLGVIKSVRAIPVLVRAYRFPKLKRMVLVALNHIGKQRVFPVLVRILKKTDSGDHVDALVKKIGAPILPYLLRGLTGSVPQKERVLAVMESIGIDPVRSKIKELAKSDPELRVLIRGGI